MKEDIVNPKRYTQNKLQCWDFWIKAGLDPLIASAVKYVWRYKYKNGIDDLNKSRVFLEKAIDEVSKSSDMFFSEREYVLKPSDVGDFTDKQFLFVHLSTKTTYRSHYDYYCSTMLELLNTMIEEEKENIIV